MPYEVGLLYSHNERTNRMFFRGVLAGLEYCVDNDKDNSCNYELVVKGDCKCVIDVLNQTTGRSALLRFYDIAKNLENRLKAEKQVDIRYEHIPRNEKIYQRIDQCAKRARGFIERELDIK
jgi:ribonuclease HI